MQLDIGNSQPKIEGMSGDTYPKVKEDDTCRHWECIGDEVLTPMHECWYCKYSDFRKDMSRHLTHSVCRCPQNRITGEGKEV